MNGALAAQDAQERFARFRRRPDIQSVTARYADWARTSDGMLIHAQLAGFAMTRLGGRMTRNQYRASVRQLASGSKIPARDFALLAECGRELARCLLVGSGQLSGSDRDCGWDDSA